ncbi:MAG TPA: hypothetical protein VFU13_15615 [Steroidobacteraceae bacterium]|nr:hypothetical protein [Steroidobacteraceae bacterium]
MREIRSGPLPAEALHAKYAREGAYTDCFTTEVPGHVSHARFVEAFYTSRVFKLERWILKWAVAKPSTDAEARELAGGARDRFAAWTVEERASDQLLMCDYLGQTRSWLMVARCEPGGSPATRLHFGSVVVRVRSFPFNVLLGFHKLYSRMLLSSARTRLAELELAD